MSPDFYRTKAQNNVVFRHSNPNEFFGNPVFCAIALDPQLSIDNINMDQSPVYTLPFIPPDIHEKVAIVHPIKHDFGLNIAVGIGNLRIFSQNGFDNLAISL